VPFRSRPTNSGATWSTASINSADIVYGLDGNDFLNYAPRLADNDLFGGNGYDLVNGGAGNDCNGQILPVWLMTQMIV